MGRSTNTITTAPGYIQQEQTDMNNLNAQDAAVQNTATNGSPLVQAQLQQATNNNIANSTGVMASAKGINPGMAARQAGYNAANSGQQAATSSAQTQGQIQLGAQSQLSNNLNTQYGTDTGLMNNQANLQQQNNQFQAELGMQTEKQFMSSIGSVVGMGAAKGGMVPKMALGGSPPPAEGDPMGIEGQTITKVGQNNTMSPMIQPQQDPYAQMEGFFNALSSNGNSGPNSQAGKMLSSGLTGSANSNPELSSNPQESPTPDDAQMMSNPEASPSPDDVGSVVGFFKGGKTKKKIPAMVSPGEVYLKPGQAKQVAKGKANPIKAGEKIPGKPKVPGNSYANDVVHKNLDAGGVVIPNSVMQSSDPAHNAYKFVQAVMAKNRAKGKR